MCGIIGVVGNKKFDAYFSVHLAKFLHEAEIRGREAFGYVADGTPGFHIEKHPGSPSKFFSKPKRIKKFVKKLNGMSAFIGHTRSATSSNAQENKNNHPFTSRRFALSHNGHISNHEKLLKEFGITSKITTDSFAILALIDMCVRVQKLGVVEAIAETTGLLEGSYSCWLYDKEEGKIYLFRHSNPCSYFVQDGCLFFASTPLILNRAFSLGKEKFKPEDTDEHVILSFTPGDDCIRAEGGFTPKTLQQVYGEFRAHTSQQMVRQAEMYPYSCMQENSDEEILRLSGATDDEKDVRKALGQPEVYYHEICERCTAFDEYTKGTPCGLNLCKECKVFLDAVNSGVSWVSLLRSNQKFVADMRVATRLLNIKVDYNRHNDLIIFTEPGGGILSIDGIGAFIWRIRKMYRELMTKNYWPAQSLGLISYWEN